MKIDLETVRRALAERAHRPATLLGDEKFAAVALVLCERKRNGEAEVLLIRRSEHPTDPWSGHMAFPGGRSDSRDPDLLHTAVRETAEEVGLPLSPSAHLIGRLDDLPAVARGQRVGLVIAVFVFGIPVPAGGGEPVLAPHAAEVTEALWAPLAALASGERNTTFAYRLHGRSNEPGDVVQLPAYDVDGRVVWGLTHRMLGMLFEVLDGTSRPRYERQS